MDGKLAYEITADARAFVAEMGSALASLGKLSAGITAAAAGAGLIGAGVGIGLGVKVAAEREQVRIAFKNIIGDAATADKVLRELFDFSNTTPFESGEIQQAALKLINAGVSTKDLRGELTALGNVAAGVGTDIGGLASIYSQIADKGRVMAEELMQLGERGAGAIKTQLAKELGVTKEVLMDMTSKGQVSFAQFRNALQSLAGPAGAWGKLMEEQSKSTLGLFSSLKDAANELLAAFGAPINDAIKPVLNDAIGLANALKPVVGEIGTAMGKAVTSMRDFVANAGSGSGLAAAMMSAVGEAFASIWDYVQPVMAAAGAVAMQMATGVGGVLNAVFSGLAMKVKSLGPLLESVMEGFLGQMFADAGMTHTANKHFKRSFDAGGREQKMNATGDAILKTVPAQMERELKALTDVITEQANELSNLPEQARAKSLMREAAQPVKPYDPLAAMQADNPFTGDFRRQQEQDAKQIKKGMGKQAFQNPFDQAESAEKEKAALRDKQAREKAYLDQLRQSSDLAASGLRNAGQAGNAVTSKRGSGGGDDGEKKRGSIRTFKGDEGVRRKWDQLNPKDKQRYGNDPGKWYQDKYGGTARNGPTLGNMPQHNKMVEDMNRIFPQTKAAPQMPEPPVAGPRTPPFLGQWGKGSVDARMGAAFPTVGAGARGQGAAVAGGPGEKAAQTQDSTSRMLLQRMAAGIDKLVSLNSNMQVA